jgi:hypothetical protein
VGGFSGLTARFRRRGEDDRSGQRYEVATDEYDEIEETADDAEGAEISAGTVDDSLADDVPLLEERVLEAFNNDPILAERAIDIGTLGSGIIELAGWVDSDDEAEHAMTIARGVPGVGTVVNRLLVDDEEHQLGENVRRLKDGDAALNETRWEGQQVGTGRRRQGTSAEADRHADPKPVLEDRWLSEREAVRNAADDLDAIAAERRKGRSKRPKPPRADQAEPPA